MHKIQILKIFIQFPKVLKTYSRCRKNTYDYEAISLVVFESLRAWISLDPWRDFYVMGLILKVFVWSLNYQHFELLSISVAEISDIAPFLFSTTRLSVHKNGRNSDDLPTDMSATEKLSITKYC